MASTNQHDAPSSAEQRTRLREILDDAGTVMLITRDRAGASHIRPMAVAQVDDDGTIYLGTSFKTAKIGEIQADARVDLVFQGKVQFATVSGTTAIRRDRALVNELWKESWKLWFPEGKDDPDITILVITPDRGEYWDQSGISGISFLFRAAKAYVTGKEMDYDPESHGKVSL
jgi:general stress protein 26